ncbi:hypothetical protein [Enterobacter mori]|uniref:hypothetical protein n=1 Tax=Enterobacter mori TaxID=539813 RepID=UPI003B83E3BB
MQNLMPPVDTPDNLFHDGDPTQGIEGTIVEAEWMNNSQGATRDVQQEIINVLLAAGINPDPANQGQLLLALQQMISGDIDGALDEALLIANNLSEIATSGEPARQAARDNLGLGTAATHDAEDFLSSNYQPPAAPVTSVNGETGAVQLSALDVDAVATVNNVSPDANGNVNINIPPPADLSNYWTKTESDARYGAGRTVNGTNNAYYTHGNGVVFMQAVNNINVANNTTVTVTLPTSFPAGIKGVSASFDGTGGADQDSFYFCRAVGANQVQIETHNCSGLFSLNVTGY